MTGWARGHSGEAGGDGRTSGGDAVAAFTLGLVEPFVGPAEQFRRGQRRLPGGGRHAQADGDGEGALLVSEGVPLDQAADALGEVDSPFAGRLGEDDGEL